MAYLLTLWPFVAHIACKYEVVKAVMEVYSVQELKEFRQAAMHIAYYD